MNPVRRCGPSRCFYEEDLYTTRFGDWESTEIEQHFFGDIDKRGSKAVQYWAGFQHPSIDGDAFQDLMLYMSTQKLRTPKGLAFLADQGTLSDKNAVLMALQGLRHIFCAMWTECVWSVVDASETETKFILTDHPVTVYNRACFPRSQWCREHRDPDVRLTGTQTIFPLCPDKALFLTHLSWARNPYEGAMTLRPNPTLMRNAIFNFHEVQTGRSLTESEVVEVNYVLKKRAYRYVAATEADWLYPEKQVTSRWDKLGRGYLFMPDPRSLRFGGELFIGNKDGTSEAYDEYGHRPWQHGYTDKRRRNEDWAALEAFQGEFARLYGPTRRGASYEMGFRRDEDDADYHAYHLSLEGRHAKGRSRRRARGKRRKNRR